MWNDTRIDDSDSSGPALSLQLDTGVRLATPFVVHATLLYDYSSWLEMQSLTRRYDGSMIGFGLLPQQSTGGAAQLTRAELPAHAGSRLGLNVVLRAWRPRSNSREEFGSSGRMQPNLDFWRVSN